MKAPTRSERQRRIAEAVADPEWQTFRKSLKGLDTRSKVNNLREYYQARCVGGGQFASESLKIQVDNYLKALARGGQLPRGISLEQAITWDWNLRVLK